jgi:hypothetical protein
MANHLAVQAVCAMNSDHGYPSCPGSRCRFHLQLRALARFSAQTQADHSGGGEAVLLILWLQPTVLATSVLTRPLPCDGETADGEPLPHDQDQTVSGNPEPSRYTVHTRAVLDAAGHRGDVTNHLLLEGRMSLTESIRYVAVAQYRHPCPCIPAYTAAVCVMIVQDYSDC